MAQKKLSRQDLINLIDELREPSNIDRRNSLADKLRAQLPGTDVLNLCESDLPSETIVDFCLNYERTKRVLDRQELIELVKAIRHPEETTEAEDMLMLETFVHNCRHPAGSDLIYYPDDVFGEGAQVTDEMIVDKALENT